jgi:hypothetical protein
MNRRFSGKQFVVLLLPALFFVLWAWLTSEQDLRTHLSGKWHSENGHVSEIRVHGDDLEIWQNGRKDPKSTYRFVSDNVVEFVNYWHKPPTRILIKMRIRRGVLEMQIGDEIYRAQRIK